MTGVCIVRVEVQANGVLLTVLTKRDADGLDAATTASQWFASVDDAVAAVDSFLRGFEVPPGGVASTDAR